MKALGRPRFLTVIARPTREREEDKPAPNRIEERA
jgi:hypothetical protein